MSKENSLINTNVEASRFLGTHNKKMRTMENPMRNEIPVILHVVSILLQTNMGKLLFQY